jgi:hypothetical protein
LSPSPEIYLTGVKAGVLLVAQTADQGGVAFYSIISQAGSELTKSFTYNMGVDYFLFGQPKNGGHCLIGLQLMHIFLYRDPAFSQSASFEFTFYGNEIGDITANYVGAGSV